jgi:hypothetical protein
MRSLSIREAFANDFDQEGATFTTEILNRLKNTTVSYRFESSPGCTVQKEAAVAASCTDPDPDDPIVCCWG